MEDAESPATGQKGASTPPLDAPKNPVLQINEARNSQNDKKVKKIFISLG